MNAPFAPPIAHLTRRLLECPPECLLDPLLAGAGVIHTAALVGDLLAHLGEEPPVKEWLPHFPPEGEGKEEGKEEKNRRLLVQIACWLLHDPWFHQRPDLVPPALAWLTRGLAPLARLVPASDCINDPDRREELVRLALAALGLLPEGETGNHFQDRLAALDTVERDQVVRRAEAVRERQRREREAQRAREEAERARRVKEAMERGAASGAAPKVSRE